VPLGIAANGNRVTDSRGRALSFESLEVEKGSTVMLRKAMWTGLYAGLGAVATMAARRAATGIWHVATGEDPPVKRK